MTNAHDRIRDVGSIFVLQFIAHDKKSIQNEKSRAKEISLCLVQHISHTCLFRTFCMVSVLNEQIGC